MALDQGVSGKQVFTEIARVQQQREAIRREMAACEKEPDRSFEPNYKQFKAITGKIGHEVQVSDTDRKALAEMKGKVEALSKDPQEKSKDGLPPRVSDEIGWLWKEAFKPDGPWLDRRLPKKTCPETAFAARYVELQADGRGPYNKALVSGGGAAGGH